MIIRTCGRRFFSTGAIVLAAAGIVFLADPLPAQAGPVSVRAEAVQRGESSLAGAGLTLDLDSALDLAAGGVTVTAVSAARKVDGGINLKVDSASKLTYAEKITGGKVLLQGGIQLSKDSKKVVVSKVSVDIRTGSVTATVGGRAGTRIGSVVEPGSAEVVKNKGTNTVTLKLAEQGIRLAADFSKALDAALGTALADQVDADTAIEARLDVDVDLADGDKPNAALISALGLDFDADGGSAALRDADVAVDISL
ncbi:hypothetical protein [Nocardia pseudobrasiliensis]|uniref:hypothetical protein n=1 Tax=Nocardia pseudobrasiliensis TaxID=45979 RepID=UPI0011C03A98|nr:hypothetical protein [Nocardia pseudobrasiliensis]